MEENNKIRQEILISVRGLSDEQLNEQLEEDRWSIMQVLDHLYLMEQVITQSISRELATGKEKVVDPKPIELAVIRSTKIGAPSFVVPSNEFITLEEMKNKLSQSREGLTKLVNDADKSLLKKRAFPHPAFGDLSLKQWIPFVGLHEKRHLAQIEELKGKLI
ncbi:DinB family protein [Neobacillus terrae]|uniref:DinB family protein n=1 Tax=Neobacillus terrae TaxID=3034837 RepID=UPI001409F8D0|nr:DinB family protein [Neobacillus terrae]NHM30897.1 DinB family protein [Neobacillus terrae]